MAARRARRADAVAGRATAGPRRDHCRRPDRASGGAVGTAPAPLADHPVLPTAGHHRDHAVQARCGCWACFRHSLG
ncbi:hypothetical protein ACTMU2_00900 [Cupriavidus basilensis]